uniref:Uncharacterized protein n=1 Tax=Arundo donax TaxID=35708 RepID=A0A0A8ZUA0_ARUDO
MEALDWISMHKATTTFPMYSSVSLIAPLPGLASSFPPLVTCPFSPLHRGAHLFIHFELLSCKLAGTFC